MKPVLWLVLFSVVLTLGSAGTGSAYPASGLAEIGQQTESPILADDKKKSRRLFGGGDKREGSEKRRGIGARMFGPYWGYGLRLGNKCDDCSSKCEDEPKSAPCQRCRAGCRR